MNHRIILTFRDNRIRGELVFKGSKYEVCINKKEDKDYLIILKNNQIIEYQVLDDVLDYMDNINPFNDTLEYKDDILFLNEFIIEKREEY